MSDVARLRVSNTVKPVYNGQPWDLKTWPLCRGLYEKDQWLQAGRYGFRLAVVDRWPLFRGGC